jgi:hypothetical protein
VASKLVREIKHPLAEVFGYKITDTSPEAKAARKHKLCPFNNIVPACTKDKKDRPLGVCTILDGENTTIICPVRFRENWRICEDSAKFFFPQAKHWTILKEVRLKEKTGKSAGNVDLIIAEHDNKGRILNFGAVEVQAVYISGNIRNPFEYYIKDPDKRTNFDWTKEKYYPTPDFLSSSRKRLIPQVMYKGQIFRAWGKKMVVAVDLPFFETLPDFPTTSEKDADICWSVYNLNDSAKANRFNLNLYKKVYSGFDDTLKKLGTPEIGDESDFISHLEEKLSKELAELSQLGFESTSDFLKRSGTMPLEKEITI